MMCTYYCLASPNFATTALPLCSYWAQTPQELGSEIHYQASLRIKAREKCQLTDPNGTHLVGVVMPARNPSHWKCSGHLRVRSHTQLVSRYIGIAPYFAQPVRLTIKNNRILKIDRGGEGETMRRFPASLHDRLGESTYDFDALHFGVHPQAHVAPRQCSSILYPRLIEHSHDDPAVLAVAARYPGRPGLAPEPFQG